MGVVHLEELDGWQWQPIAEIGELDRRLLGATEDAVAAVRARAPEGEVEFEARRLAQRQELQRRQGIASYVGGLADIDNC